MSAAWIKRVGVALATVAALAYPGYRAYVRFTTPDPPAVALREADPMVEAAIKTATARLASHRTAGAEWGELAMLYHVHGYLPQAKLCYRQAERLDPRNSAWPYLYGESMLKDGDPSVAVASLRRAADLAGDMPVARMRLAEQLIQQGQHDEADRLLWGVELSIPGEPRAQLGLARIALAKGNARGAVTHATATVAKTGYTAQTAAVLAEAYFRLGEHQQAEETRRKGARAPQVGWQDPYIELLASKRLGLIGAGQRAAEMLRQGKFSEARAILEDLVVRYPASAPARNGLGRVLLLAGDAAAAEARFREARQMDPAFTEARYYLGESLARQGKHREAAPELEAYLAAEPGSGKALAVLGECYQALGDRSRSLRSLRAAVEADPNHADAQKRLGLMLLEMGQAKDAAAHLRIAVERLPDDAALRGALARAAR